MKSRVSPAPSGDYAPLGGGCSLSNMPERRTPGPALGIFCAGPG
jgi:hypothetical protein